MVRVEAIKRVGVAEWPISGKDQMPTAKSEVFCLIVPA